MLRGLQLLQPNQGFEERKGKMAHSSSIFDDKKVQDVEAPEDGLRDLDVDLEVGGDDILRLEHTDPVLNAKVRTSKFPHRTNAFNSLDLSLPWFT